MVYCKLDVLIKIKDGLLKTEDNSKLDACTGGKGGVRGIEGANGHMGGALICRHSCRSYMTQIKTRHVLYNSKFFIVEPFTCCSFAYIEKTVEI